MNDQFLLPGQLPANRSKPIKLKANEAVVQFVFTPLFSSHRPYVHRAASLLHRHDRPFFHLFKKIDSLDLKEANKVRTGGDVRAKASLNACFMEVSCTLNRVPHKQNC